MSICHHSVVLLILAVPALGLGCSSETATGQTPSAGTAGQAGANTAGAGTSGSSSGAAGQATTGGTTGGGTPATGGTSGAAGSGGASEGGGGVGGASGSGGNGGAPPTSKDFTCSWVLGITTTGEWYKAGFEKVVDDERWQVTPIEMGHLEKWADPNHEIWQSAIQSPCATNSEKPDRVVFNATKYEWTTVDEFLPAYVAVVNNIKIKYPSVLRIDLITYGRAPGNVECVGANRSSYSYIKAAQDDAAAMIPGMFPGFVFVAPKWEHQACSDFGLCPHVTAEANARLATTIGQYFLEN